MGKFIDLTGKKFGRLLVLGRGPNTEKHNMARWHCVCDCGNETLSWGQSLRDGYAASCGCLNSEINTERARNLNLRHGEAGKDRSPLYRTWRSIMGRCHQVNHGAYSKYGGKGTKVCERWHIFENFKEDMPPRPTPQHSIDRIDNAGHYDPSNCRWATMAEQANHKTNSVYLTMNGERLTASQWSKRLGIKPGTISSRKRNGWSDEECLTIAPGKYISCNHAKLT